MTASTSQTPDDKSAKHERDSDLVIHFLVNLMINPSYFKRTARVRSTVHALPRKVILLITSNAKVYGIFSERRLFFMLTSPALKREMPLSEMSQLHRHLALTYTLL